MTTSHISFGLETQGGELEAAVLLDGVIMFEDTVSDLKKSCVISFEDSDEEKQHNLEIKLFGKSTAHTKVDEFGNIISDRTLKINNIQFEDLAIQQIFYENSVYRHDFNGTAQEVEEKFFGEMGCNGTVTLNFTSPFYAWLLSKS